MRTSKGCWGGPSDPRVQGHPVAVLHHLPVVGDVVKVYYTKGKHIVIFFPAKELKQALGVLKALATYFKADFIWKAARDLEDDLTPKLTFDSPYRICENCMCEIDLRGGNSMYVDNTWLHKTCPTLKEGRPV
jgi:hypothetical protein